MLRLRAVLILLLPVLWLVAAMPCPVESLGLDNPDFCASSSATEETTPDSPQETASPIDSARCLWRRSPSEEIQIVVQYLNVTPVAQPNPAPAFLSNTSPAGADLVLPQGWQFLWRTALPVRAPSLLL